MRCWDVLDYEGARKAVDELVAGGTVPYLTTYTQLLKVAFSVGDEKEVLRTLDEALGYHDADCRLLTTTFIAGHRLRSTEITHRGIELLRQHVQLADTVLLNAALQACVFLRLSDDAEWVIGLFGAPQTAMTPQTHNLMISHYCLLDDSAAALEVLRTMVDAGISVHERTLRKLLVVLATEGEGGANTVVALFEDPEVVTVPSELTAISVTSLLMRQGHSAQSLAALSAYERARGAVSQKSIAYFTSRRSSDNGGTYQD